MFFATRLTVTSPPWGGWVATVVEIVVAAGVVGAGVVDEAGDAVGAVVGIVVVGPGPGADAHPAKITQAIPRITRNGIMLPFII
jgi:hypothetical protein